MPMDRFSTEFLLGVVQDLRMPSQFILDRYFGTIQTFETEAVDVEVVKRARRLAPLVSPLVPGRVMNQTGRELRSIKPAYIKDKRIFRPGEALKRAVGERIGGEYSPEQRLQIQISGELEDQIKMVNRRMEIMALESLRKGTLTLSGADYPSVTVDFQRDASLTVTLAGADAWDQATSSPLAKLKELALISMKLEGVYPSDVVMSTEAFDLFVAHPKVEKRWQAQNASVINYNLKLGDKLIVGAKYMGSIEGFDIYVYSDWYIDDTGAEVNSLPANELVMVAPELDGRRLFGAIQDFDAGIKAVPYFPKMWLEKDPSAEFLMLQSAPLTAPLRPNASVGLKVK